MDGFYQIIVETAHLFHKGLAANRAQGGHAQTRRIDFLFFHLFVRHRHDVSGFFGTRFAENTIGAVGCDETPSKPFS